MQSKLKFSIFILTTILVLGLARPVKAFYLEVPDFFVKALNALKSNISSAQEGPAIMPGPGATYAPGDSGQRVEPTPGTAQPPMDNYQSQPYNSNQPTQPNQPSGTFYCYSLSRQATGSECDAADQANRQNNNYQPQPQPQPQPYNQNQNMMNQGGMQSGGMQNGPGMNQGGGNYLKDMQRGVKQMERSVKQLETQIQRAEKNGTIIGQSLKDKISQAKTTIDCVKNAQDETTMQACNAEDMGDLMQDLEEQRQSVVEAAQRLQQVKRDVKNAESGVKMFERQLSKAGSCVPVEVKDNLANIKKTIDTIKNAKTWQEVEDAGLGDMGAIFSDLDSARPILEMCTRWPQMSKEVNKAITNLERQLKKAKSAAARLSAKGIDLSTVYSTFEADVNKLKTVRDEANAKMQNGDAEGAMSSLEDDFFGQMDDVMQNAQIIEMMTNLGQFNSKFKQEISQANRDISSLSRKGMDVSELKDILAQIKAKGAEITAAMKTVQNDPEGVLDLIGELEDLSSQFDTKKADLTGEESSMPILQGNNQLQKLELPTGLQGFMQPKQTQQMTPGGASGMFGSGKSNPVGESNPQPSPKPQGMCVPPDCTE